MFDLNGKVAFITGGAGGIGLGIAKALLENGVKGVALIDINDEQGKIASNELTKEFSKECVHYINADVTQRSQLEGAFEHTIGIFKRLDIVINCAGVVQEFQWERCIQVNLQGCVTGSLLALDKYFPKILGNSEGIILNVASVAGLMPLEITPVYCGTKHGIIGFSRSLSGPSRCHNLNVKILTICPGATDTSMGVLKKHQVVEELYEEAARLAEIIPYQSTYELASHVIPILGEGETGSVWLINDNTRKQIEFPNLFSLF